MAAAAEKKREANLELFRIFLMLGIVAHHYVVHSGLLDAVYASGGGASIQNIFIVILGAWGKIGINCFVLITGYFMCKSKISLKKFLKLLLEVEFYDIAAYLFFVILGKDKLTFDGVMYAIFPIQLITSNFTGCFLVFYMLIPFVNTLIRNLNRKQHVTLLFVLIFFLSLLPTLPSFIVAINYVTWFGIVYLIGSYIRLYLPKPNKKQLRISAILSLILVMASCASVVFGLKMGRSWLYWFVTDSNKFIAIATATALFMLFLNIKMKYHPLINAVAASVFGVLLIHDNGKLIRNLLWVRIFKNASFYGSKKLYPHAFLVITGVFLACVVIDRLRIVLLERPIFKKMGARMDKIDMRIRKLTTGET